MPILMKNHVSATELSHGAVGRTLSELSIDHPIVVMRNNQPAAVMIAPEEYDQYVSMQEDYALLQEAVQRLLNDTGIYYSQEEMEQRYPLVDDGYEPEFE